MIIEILDTTIPGEIKNSLKIDLEEITTPEKIIVARVTEEVKIYNEKADVKLNSLVQPEKKEKLLNGVKKKYVIDAEKQTYVALEAFQKNGFFILVDDEQVTELHQEIKLKKESKISFIKLTSLVGG